MRLRSHGGGPRGSPRTHERPVWSQPSRPDAKSSEFQLADGTAPPSRRGYQCSGYPQSGVSEQVHAA